MTSNLRAVVYAWQSGNSLCSVLTTLLAWFGVHPSLLPHSLGMVTCIISVSSLAKTLTCWLKWAFKTCSVRISTKTPLFTARRFFLAPHYEEMSTIFTSQKFPPPPSFPPSWPASLPPSFLPPKPPSLQNLPPSLLLLYLDFHDWSCYPGAGEVLPPIRSLRGPTRGEGGGGRGGV